ncbi:MAG: flagellar biosynthesis protein FlgA [Streptosporangiales bacterium]|nr:flagellar biosynthesis protein FlgA [Streptosporangiales bacterium]
MAGEQSTPVADRAEKSAGAPAESGLVMPRSTVPRRRRRPVMVLVGALLCVNGGLVGAWLSTTAADTAAVLVVARPVAYGDALTAADVRVTQITVGAGVSVVPASRRSQVLGQFATRDLRPSTLLTRSALSRQRVPGPGEELVGVAVSASRMPNQPLRAQDQVAVVSTPPDDADPPTEQPDELAATVVSVGRPDANGIRVVDLRVPAGAGAALAARAATGRVALVLRAPGE